MLGRCQSRFSRPYGAYEVGKKLSNIICRLIWSSYPESGTFESAGPCPATHPVRVSQVLYETPSLIKMKLTTSLQVMKLSGTLLNSMIPLTGPRTAHSPSYGLLGILPDMPTMAIMYLAGKEMHYKIFLYEQIRHEAGTLY